MKPAGRPNRAACFQKENRMYIWIGCQLPGSFEKELRSFCLAQNESLGLDTAAFALPQHISLKISFDAGEEYEAVLDALEDILHREEKFYVNPLSPEVMGNILWITFRENGTLRRLHGMLDEQLQQRFAIGQHPFDRDFRFHSTLYFGDTERLGLACQRLAGFPLPENLAVDTFLLGISPDGSPGSYRVVRQVKV